MSQSTELKTKLAELKRRIDNNEMTLEQANQLLQESKTPGIFENLFNPSKWNEDVKAQNNQLAIKEAEGQLAEGLSKQEQNIESIKQIGDIYGDNYKKNLGTRGDFITGVQGGTNLDMLNAANRHDVNMAVIDPVSKFMQAIALKNILD